MLLGRVEKWAEEDLTGNSLIIHQCKSPNFIIATDSLLKLVKVDTIVYRQPGKYFIKATDGNIIERE
jgi:hypothetical protein